MRDTFASVLPLVLKHEGGYVNHPNDPGGETNKGITWRTYAAWRRSQGLPEQSVRHITDSEVRAIYKAQYWDAVRGDDLPAGLDYAVFDFAVNSGPARAAKFLQRQIGVPQDGVIGSHTLSAIPADTIGLVRSLCDARLAWLRTLRHWGTFGRGWTARVLDVKEVAAGMVTRDFAEAPGKAVEPERTSPAQSTTVQAGTVQAVTAVSGGVSAVAALDGTAQIVALVVCGVVLLAAVWIMRERLAKWAEGVR